MLKHFLLTFSLIVGGGGFVSTNAQTHTRISLPSLFSDHIVLQQQDSVPVWGWGEAGTTVCAVGSWASQDTISAVVDDAGRWSLKLKTEVYGGPYTLHFFQAGFEEEGITLVDVMLGEVWLCSGQSNMEFSPANGIANQAEEIGAANYSNLRFFSIEKRGSQSLQDDCKATWECCSPDVMQRRSAVAYFFGRHLYENLKIPIGLIVSAWGGSAAEVWIPKSSLPKMVDFPRIQQERKCPWWPVEPGTLYNSMIHPLLPYRIAGAIWYQGESNRDDPQSYFNLMKTLITSWRKGFQQDFPFYLVQIAPFNYQSKNNGPALIREAQAEIARQIPYTGLVVTNDVGDFNNIHPARKQEVGIRLANLALGDKYGRKEIPFESPCFEAMEIQKAKIRIRFSQPIVCKEKVINGFQIADEQGHFVQAHARIIGDDVIEVWAKAIKHPMAVRYCFDDATVGNLQGTNSLPVEPFRTDKK